MRHYIIYLVNIIIKKKKNVKKNPYNYNTPARRNVLCIYNAKLIRLQTIIYVQQCIYIIPGLLGAIKL